MGQPATLFTRIGGMPAVNTAVDIFYRKVLADASVARFFERVPMDGQSGKMKAFLAYSFGAPLPFTGKNMAQAHAHMHLTEAHFSAVAHHIAETLQEMAVPQNLIDEVMRIVRGTKDDVLDK